MTMCSNCGSDATGGVVVSHGKTLVAAVCDACTDGVKTAKIVLVQEDGVFRHEQYSALEMQERAFGKVG